MNDIDFVKILRSTFDMEDIRVAAATRKVAHHRPLQERIKVKKAFKAAVLGDLQKLQELVKNADQANWLNDEGWRCLLDSAVRSESRPLVQWLLDMGADPCTLFHGDRIHRGDGPFPTGMYFSPFATATTLKSPDIALLMLQRGASLDLPVWCVSDSEMMTCRDLAEEKGHWPALEAWLLSQVAKPARPNPNRPARL